MGGAAGRVPSTGPLQRPLASRGRRSGRRARRRLRDRDDRDQRDGARADLRHRVRRAAQRAREDSADRRFSRPRIRRPRGGDDRLLAPAAQIAGDGGSDRGQCAARRAHVVARWPRGGRTDLDLERQRRLGWARGRLRPDRRRHRIADRRCFSAASAGSSHPGRLRRGRRHGRRLRRPADGRHFTRSN